MRTILRTLVTLVLASLLLAACGSASRPTTPPQEPQQEAHAQFSVTRNQNVQTHFLVNSITKAKFRILEVDNSFEPLDGYGPIQISDTVFMVTGPNGIEPGIMIIVTGNNLELQALRVSNPWREFAVLPGEVREFPERAPTPVPFSDVA